MYSLQGHAIYAFNAGVWGFWMPPTSLAGYTTIDGTESSDLQQNWRLGGTLTFLTDGSPLDQALRQGQREVSARTDNNYNLPQIAPQYR
ncbi:MAG: hypothetical protein IPI21_12440 [Propionivibrio sp.]|nr:hypothetical protein [Propionivibrio sp.]